MRRVRVCWLALLSSFFCLAHAFALDPAKQLSAYGRQSWRTDSGLPQNTVHAILQTHDGYIWFATEGGIVRFDGFKFAVFDSQNAPETAAAPPQPADPHVLCRYRDKEGVLWIGSDAGLTRIYNGKTDHFAASDPLSTETVLSIFEDREGNLWIGTDSDGVTVLRDQKFTSYTAKDGLPSDLVRCIFEDRKGTLWIGTESGLARFESGRLSVLTTANGLSSNVILSLAEDASGNLLVGTPDGLNILQPKSVKIVTSADGLPDDFIRSIYLDKDGSLWIGTRRGLAHLQSNHVKIYTIQSGLGDDLVGAITRDSNHVLWVGTLHGLSRLEGDRFVTSLKSDPITALWAGDDGALWVGTDQYGLKRLVNNKLLRYAASTTVPNVIFGIVPDTYGRLWIASKSGIFRRDANHPDAMAHFTAADGLPVSECSDGGHPSVWRTHDGALWFAMSKGLATTQPGSDKNRPAAIPVVVESLTVDDRSLLPADAHDIAPGHTRFAFDYAGLSFRSPQSVTYKYKLEGFDKNWIDAGTRRVAYYTNLSPATYNFRVLARTNDGTWTGSGASFSFRLRPRFHQTYWFDLLVVVAVLFLAWQVYRWRVKQVKAQYDAVVAERTRIAREIHDGLAQGFVGVSLQLELVAQALSQSKEAAREILSVAQQSVQDSLADARRSIWELRSYTPDNDDLPSRLSKIAAQVNSTTPIKARFQVFGTRRPLPENVEHELLKIGQEAVANALRHATATEVHIDLSYEPKRLSLAVIDNGRGFTPTANGSGPDGHYGLRGMRERAEQIRARLDIQSAPGKGVQILVQTDIE